jgi:hypothetical protein
MVLLRADDYACQVGNFSPMNRLALAALFALLLPGCPLADEYYVVADDGQANRVVAPYCGDGTVNGPEACDGADLGGKSCELLGLGTGVLACNAQCGYEVSGCMPPKPVCGDGVAQGQEPCDGVDLATQTCASLGLDQGPLACTPSCGFDFSGCTPNPAVCGNGIAQGAESCDGADLRGYTCSSFGLSAGTLACASSCTFDFAGCADSTPVCGDGVAETTEPCDAADLQGESCESLGLGPGTLTCTASCAFDTAACGTAPGCDGTSGVTCCDHPTTAEVCDGVSNDCDEEIDEGGVCPEDGTGATFGGHIYLLYLYSQDYGGGGRGNQQEGSWNGESWNQADYGEATTTCRAAGSVLGLGVELDLARIESAEENEFLRTWIAGAATEEGMVWMGANDLVTENRWVWGQDANAVQFFTGSARGGGTPVMNLFNDFMEGRPNSANGVDEDCGAFDSEYDWHWNDLDCSVPRLGVLCEQL